MSIAPFSTRPAPSDGHRSEIGQPRTRLALAIATVGIAATLLAYAASPGVRHAVGHAEHSVKHAVSNVFDRDHAARARPKPAVRPAPAAPAGQRAHTRTTPPRGQAKGVGG